MNYTIEYQDEEGVHTEEHPDCGNVGTAFALCLKKHPGAKLIKGRTERFLVGHELWIDYTPPPTQRDPVTEPLSARKPKRDDKEGVMPFYDEVQK